MKPLIKLIATGLILCHGRFSLGFESSGSRDEAGERGSFNIDNGDEMDIEALWKGIPDGSLKARLRSISQNDLKSTNNPSNHLHSQLRGVVKNQKQNRKSLVTSAKLKREEEHNHRVSFPRLKTKNHSLKYPTQFKIEQMHKRTRSASSDELPSCSENTSTSAGEYTCGARINHVRTQDNLSLRRAVSKIVREGFTQCNCDSSSNGGGSSSGRNSPSSGGGEYVQIFREEFDGNAIDQTLWTHEHGRGPGNGEEQIYGAEPENSYIEDGSLKIKATKDNRGVWHAARLNTFSKFDFSFGRVETRVRISSKADGPFPAVWALGNQQRFNWFNWRSNWTPPFPRWPKCGEIDFFEYQSEWNGYVPSTLHFQAHHYGNSMGFRDHHIYNSVDQWHVYSMEWTSTYIAFFHDNREIGRYNKPRNANRENWPYSGSADRNPFHLVVNLAMNPGWGTKAAPHMSDWLFEVDYIAVFQKEGEIDYTLRGNHVNTE